MTLDDLAKQFSDTIADPALNSKLQDVLSGAVTLETDIENEQTRLRQGRETDHKLDEYEALSASVRQFGKDVKELDGMLFPMAGGTAAAIQKEIVKVDQEYRVFYNRDAEITQCSKNTVIPSGISEPLIVAMQERNRLLARELRDIRLHMLVLSHRQAGLKVSLHLAKISEGEPTT